MKAQGDKIIIERLPDMEGKKIRGIVIPNMTAGAVVLGKVISAGPDMPANSGVKEGVRVLVDAACCTPFRFGTTSYFGCYHNAVLAIFSKEELEMAEEIKDKAQIIKPKGIVPKLN